MEMAAAAPVDERCPRLDFLHHDLGILDGAGVFEHDDVIDAPDCH
jgi:hypothetical protein